MTTAQTRTPPPSPQSLAQLLTTHIQTLQSQTHHLKALGTSLLHHGADPTRPDILELDAMYRRATSALDDATRALAIHQAAGATPPRVSIFGSPDPGSPPQQGGHKEPTALIRKREAPHDADAWPSAPLPKRARRAEPAAARKDFANPYETPLTTAENDTATAAVEADDITAEVERRLRETEERRKRRLDTPPRNGEEQEGKSVAQEAGRKRPAEGEEEGMKDGQDGGRYWLSDPSQPAHTANKTILRTLEAPGPVTKKLKQVHAQHSPRRKEPPSQDEREASAAGFRERIGAIGAGVVVTEVKGVQGYPGPGVRRAMMRGTVERAKGSKVRRRVEGFVGRLDAERERGEV